jgi:hypothetical protein
LQTKKAPNQTHTRPHDVILADGAFDYRAHVSLTSTLDGLIERELRRILVRLVGTFITTCTRHFAPPDHGPL